MSTAADPRLKELFGSYNAEQDELWLAGEPREDARPCFDALAGLGTRELKARQSRIRQACSEVGEHFYVHDKDDPIARDWRLDVMPRILPRAEWEALRQGLIQRVEAFNLYVQDLYTRQEILANRVVPVQVALSDPAFKRELTGIDIRGQRYISVAATDLMRDGEGQWWVLENHFSTPFGTSYILQNRRILAQTMPELFQSMPVSPVAAMTTWMFDALRALAPVQNPHIVLLARGEDNRTYFEESFLARHMGVAMVKPGDLIVRESKLFLKTVHGLERVDVVLRRFESASIDPIAFAHSRYNGIPGLVNCVRKGNVVITNALGCGVADNRSILRYSDRIIGHYLGQRPLLRTMPTYNLGDPDQAAFFWQNREDMVLKPIHTMAMLRQEFPKLFDRSSLNFDALARKHPELFIAQPRRAPSTAPTFVQGRFEPRPLFLRTFLVMGDEPRVLPGGLTRQLESPDRPGKHLFAVREGMKDTWVAHEEHEFRTAPHSAQEELDPGDFPIGSRVAESLYWLGRYLERAENTSRQLNTLESLRWEQLGRAAQQIYAPLWKGIVASTGKGGGILSREFTQDTLGLSQTLVLDSKEPASVTACVRAALLNARLIREFVSPETWQVLQSLDAQLREAGKETHLTRPRLREICQETVFSVAAFNGTAERTMLHEDALQFYRVGAQMERAIATITLLRYILLAEGELQPRLQETDLTAVLRLFGALDAYRREFRSRAFVDRVAHLILKSTKCPSSLGFILRMIRYSLGTVTQEKLPVLEDIDQLIEQTDAIPVQQIFPAATMALDFGQEPTLRNPEESARLFHEHTLTLLKGLEDLHQTIEDTFFSHLGAV